MYFLKCVQSNAKMRLFQTQFGSTNSLYVFLKQIFGDPIWVNSISSNGSTDDETELKLEPNSVGKGHSRSGKKRKWKEQKGKKKE